MSMDTERWRRAREIFERAVDLEPAECASVLDAACEGDAELRSEVESLLASDATDGDAAAVLDQGPAHRALPPMSELSLVGGRLGAYRILRVLGAGGMGTVYAAEQDDPRRLVALKVMRLGLQSETAMRRFRYEAEILGRLRHPGIAQIHEAGVHRVDDGEMPFFAMEFVEGAEDLVAHAMRHRPSVQARVELLVAVCEAVHHGHQNGIVHRDLKPANILVDGSGRPKVIDFGIARCTDADLQSPTVETAPGQVLGTLHYMSPEQLRGDASAIDVRADVYALGVVAFQLLTGRLPHDLTGTSLAEAARRVQEEDALRLSAVDRRLRGDLETIVAKATDKERDRRYASASELARDLRNYLDDQPVIARPPSALYQVRKFARRNRALVGAAAVSVAALAIGLVVALVQMQRAVTERTRARQVSEFTRSVLVESDLMRARGPDYTVREALDEAAQRILEQPWDDPETEADLKDTIGNSFLGLSLYERAEPYLVDAVRLRREELGADHRDTIDVEIALCLLWREQDRIDEALAALTDLRERCVARFGADDPLSLSAGHNLAMLLKDSGRFEAAEELYRDVLERRRAQLGNGAPATLDTLNNLGFLVQLLDRLPEAEEILVESLRLHRSSLGDENPRTLMAMDVLGEVYQQQGRFAEAEVLHREALAGFREVLTPEHSDTLGAAFQLLKALLSQRKGTEAGPLAEETEAACRRTFSADHPYTLRVLGVAGAAAQLEGRLDVAEQKYRAAYEGFLSARGPAYHETLIGSQNLAGVLYQCERFADAAEVAGRHLAAARENGVSGRIIAASLSILGACQLANDDAEAAERSLRECYELAKENRGADHPQTVEAARNLAHVYEVLGREADAKRFRAAVEASAKVR